jgi:DNA polymerase III gamma/tau subunit
MKRIADEAGISVEESALNLIARLAQGGMRDAITFWINAWHREKRYWAG